MHIVSPGEKGYLISYEVFISPQNLIIWNDATQRYIVHRQYRWKSEIISSLIHVNRQRLHGVQWGGKNTVFVHTQRRNTFTILTAAAVYSSAHCIMSS